MYLVKANVQRCSSESGAALNTSTTSGTSGDTYTSDGDAVGTCTALYKDNRALNGPQLGAHRNTVCCGFPAEIAFMKEQGKYDASESLFPQVLDFDWDAGTTSNAIPPYVQNCAQATTGLQVTYIYKSSCTHRVVNMHVR